MNENLLLFGDSISVRKFELAKKCKSAMEYSIAFSEDCRPFVMYDIINMVCEDLKKKAVNYESYRSVMEKRYKDEWFQLNWQKSKAIMVDVELIRRFIGWFQVTFPEAEILSVKETATYPSEVPLTQEVSMVVRKENQDYAFLIRYGKSKKSLRGKSRETNMLYDLGSMVAKFGLEKSYPGIKIANVYLQTEADKPGDVGVDFIVDATKKSQYFILGFENYYNKDEFLLDDFSDAIKASMELPAKKDCTMCAYRDVCTDETIFTELKKEVVSEKETKTCCRYTEKQTEAIRKDGATLICAGPGSGKTATLVGKIRYLIEERKIPAQFILMLSFTNEAVAEMTERCKEFCPDYNMPTISTINGLAYSILTEQRKVAGLSKYPILTNNALKGMIKAELMTRHSLDSVNLYGPLEGKYGLLNTLSRYYREWKKDGDEAFFAPCRHVLCGGEVREFLKTLDEIITDRCFITFDEQITLATKVLKENPDVLNEYRAIYQYILVDEFQDVDEEQAELIYLLAAPKNNITVVGDDDQSIYGWRGGNSRYMLEFSDRFGTSPIVLDKNFRSTSGIVKATGQVINLQSAKRIYKEVTAVKGGDAKPVFVRGSGVEKIEEIVQGLLEKGYAYGDITILARTNAELETLKDTLKIPCDLGKNYLIGNTLFRFLYNALKYFKTNSERALIELFMLFGLREIAVTYGKKLKEILADPTLLDATPDLLQTINRLNTYLSYIQDAYEEELSGEESFRAFFFAFCAILGISENAPFYIAVSNLCDLYDTKTIDEFYERMIQLRECEDDTKMNMEGSGVDSVKLLTLHESKGMEFPAVIVIDDGKANYTEDPEAMNLLYVGLTRAEKECFLLAQRLLPYLSDEIFERVGA